MSSTHQTSGSKRAAQLALSFGVGALCLWFAFHGVRAGAEGSNISPDALLSIIRAVPTSAYAGFVGLFALQVVVRVERWRLQTLGLTGRAPPWIDSLTINAFAFAAVFLMPFRLGEFVRPNLCAQRGIMSASAALAGTAVERIIDGLVATAIFGVLLVAAPFEWPPWVRAGGLSALAFFGGGVVVLIIAMRAKELAITVTTRVLGVVSAGLAARVAGMLGAFIDGLRCFRSARDIALYLLLSVVFWTLNGLGVALIVRGLDPTASYAAGFVCLCFLVIGVMLPAPPGNVGSYHAFAKLGLTVSGVATLPATAGAVLLHLMAVVTVVGLAGIFAVIGPIRVADARHALDDVGDDNNSSGTDKAAS